MSTLFWIPYQSNTYLTKRSYSVYSLIRVFSKKNVIINGNVLHVTVQMGILRFKDLIFIITTVLWHIMIT